MSEGESSKASSHLYAVWVAFGILLSRIAGLVRDRVFAHYLGNSDAAGAFRAALRIPNFLQNLFGEGVLSASFIPIYARLNAQQDKQMARAVAGAVGAFLALLVSILVFLGIFLSQAMVDLVAPGFTNELRELTIQIVRILFPGVGLLVLSAWCLGILNSHNKFFISYVAPVFWNLALIIALIIFGHKETQTDLVIILAWASVIGSFLQLAIQLPFVFRSVGWLPFSLNTSLAPVREIFKNLLPVLMGRGVVQISAYIDSIIASFLGAAAVSSIAYAQTIYLLPISLFGMAVAAAELPKMSLTANNSDLTALKILRTRILHSRRQIAFFVIPSAVLFLLLGRWVVAALYQTGQFGNEDTLYVWYVLMGSVIGLLPAAWGRLYSSAFYALSDTKTPLKFAILRVSLTVTFGLLFAFTLRPYILYTLMLVPGLKIPQIPEIELAIGAVGLTFASGLAGWVEYSALQWSLKKRIGEIKLPTIFMLQVWLAAIASAGLALLVERFFIHQDFSTRLYDFRSLIFIASYGIFYLLIGLALGIEESRTTGLRIVNKFSKKS